MKVCDTFRRFFDFHFDRDNNSMRKGKIIVASMMVLCVLIFVAAAAWFMLFQGEITEPTEEENRRQFYTLRA